MYVAIDTSERDHIFFLLFDEKSKKEKKVEAKNRDILKELDLFLTEEGLNKKDVQGFAVVVGEGSFTSTRLAVTVANTFAFTGEIPVATISKDELEDVAGLTKTIQSRPKGEYISASYSAEPHIG